MVDPLIDVSDLEARLGRSLQGSDQQRATAIIADVSALARAEAGQSWATSVPDAVRAVVTSAVYRVFTNPDMYTSRGAGPFSAKVHDSAFATGVFTAHELGILRSQSARSGLWTQATTRGDTAEETGFVGVQGYRDPFPYYAAEDPFNNEGMHF